MVIASVEMDIGVCPIKNSVDARDTRVMIVPERAHNLPSPVISLIEQSTYLLALIGLMYHNLNLISVCVISTK